MKGVSELIKEHDERLKSPESTDSGDEFLSFHMTQIKFLQNERLAHLIVMLFVIFISLLFFTLFLFSVD